jgi:tripartite-type tricarboxylate transporter receptor subunit TctC
MDPALKEVLLSGLRKAQQYPEYIKAMEEAGYEIDYMEGEKYKTYMENQEKLVIKYADELGFNY